MSADFKTLAAQAALPQRSISHCFRADLVADFEALERELVQAQKRAGLSLDAGAEAVEIAEHMEALRAQMHAASYDLRISALPKPRYRALVAAHPPRPALAEDGTETDELRPGDREIGVNVDTFIDALIVEGLVDPELTAEEWERLVATMTDAQYQRIADVAWQLNRGDISIPFSRAASRINRPTESE